MALIGNYSVLNKTAGRWIAGSAVAGASVAQCQSNAAKPSDWRKRAMPDRAGGTGTILQYAAKPRGYSPQGSWGLANRAGGVSSVNQANGSSTAVATLVAGRNISGTAAGTCTVTGTGKLVVAVAATAAGSCTVTGTLTGKGTIAATAAGTSTASATIANGAAMAVGTAAGTSTATASVSGVAHVAGTIAGTSTATMVRYAIGHIAGESTTASELSPTNLAEAVMSAIVESGLSLREATQAILAASAGLVTITGPTVTFRDVADTKDRITATVDGSGNRTAIVLDTDA